MNYDKWTAYLNDIDFEEKPSKPILDNRIIAKQKQREAMYASFAKMAEQWTSSVDKEIYETLLNRADNSKLRTKEKK